MDLVEADNNLFHINLVKANDNLSQSSKSSCVVDEKDWPATPEDDEIENKSRSSSLQIQTISNATTGQTQFINAKYIEIIC